GNVTGRCPRTGKPSSAQQCLSCVEMLRATDSSSSLWRGGRGGATRKRESLIRRAGQAKRLAQGSDHTRAKKCAFTVVSRSGCGKEPMPKTYDQACPVAKALEVLGDRWTLLLVRNLLRGAQRFQDFQTSLPGIAPTILSDRLKLMEEHGLIARRFYS